MAQQAEGGFFHRGFEHQIGVLFGFRCANKAARLAIVFSVHQCRGLFPAAGSGRSGRSGRRQSFQQFRLAAAGGGGAIGRHFFVGSVHHSAGL